MTRSGRDRLLAIPVLLAIVAGGATFRVDTALGDPGFDAASPDGLVKSDPALLLYITERIVEAGGRSPADFRADPRVAWPELADLPARFTVGQEFLVAWAYRVHRATGGDVPLHVFCVVFFAILASLCAVPVYGLARELSGSVGLGLLAAFLYAALPINYRTIGFVLIREDLSLPLFALHLWLAARAARVRSRASFALCGLALGAALSTWHAMGFVVALEVGVLLAWVTRTGRNPFAVPGAWLVPAVVAGVSLIVPALRAKGFVASPALVLAAGLVLWARLERRIALGPGRRVVAAAVLVAFASLAGSASRLLLGDAGDYDHVISLLLAKLRHLGRFPVDPGSLSFDARLLWQGPFATAGWPDFALRLPAITLVFVIGLPTALATWWRGRDDATGLTTGLLAVGMFAGWLVRRVLVLPGLIGPVVAVVLLRRAARPRLGAALLGALALLQGLHNLQLHATHPIAWYQPPQRGEEIRRLLRFVAENVPPEDAILADFVNGAAILAHSRHPIVVQPKYETAAARRRVEELYRTVLHEPPAALRALAGRYDSHWLLFDREAMWAAGRSIAGIPHTQQIPERGTSAWYFTGDTPSRLDGAPGFRLVYRSPALLLDKFRLYRID